MLIGDLARASGTSPRSLRHYEAHGLITPKRMHSGYRVYEPGTVERVQLIRQLMAAGLTVKEVAEVLPVLTNPASQDSPLTSRLTRERDRLEEELRAAQRKRDALSAVIVSHAELEARISRASLRAARPLPAPTRRPAT